MFLIRRIALVGEIIGSVCQSEPFIVIWLILAQLSYDPN